jgi:O-antigen ligase
MKGMTVRKAIAPAYLLLCLLLGGSAQGVWGNALLQFLAVLIIGACLLDGKARPLPRSARPLIALLGAGVVLALLQLITLPPEVWTRLPGREFIADGRSVLGLPVGWSPISMAPFATMATPLFLLPPAAMFLAIAKWGRDSEVWLVLALGAATLAAVLLGLPQVLGGNVSTSPWYLYERSNFGYATGFFANKNHMASLLLAAMPLTVALGSVAARSTKDARKRYSMMILIGGVLAIIVIGLFLTGSRAGLGLAIPVAAASALMTERAPRWAAPLATVLGVVTAGVFFLLLLTPLGEDTVVGGAAASVSSREAIFWTSLNAIREFGPVGSGLGTFEKIYPLFENPETIGRTYVNHAHNDYLELVVELGTAGAVLIAAFLLWWAISVRRMLAAPNASLFAKAGAIGSAALLVHSAVDYPLRTSAMTAVLALCLAMMLTSRIGSRTNKDFREARHLVIE